MGVLPKTDPMPEPSILRAQVRFPGGFPVGSTEQNDSEFLRPD